MNTTNDARQQNSQQLLEILRKLPGFDKVYKTEEAKQDIEIVTQGIKKLGSAWSEDTQISAYLSKIMQLPSSQGWNALIQVTKSGSPNEVKCILNTLLLLDDKDSLKSILLQTSNDGWNSLIIATRYNPECINIILDVAIAIDDKATLKALLSQRINNTFERKVHTRNALDISSRVCIDYTPKILQATLLLPISDQVEILSNSKIKQDSRTSINTEVNKSLAELEKVIIVDGTTQENPIATLRSTLDNLIEAYNKSDQSKGDYDILLEKTKEATQNCRENIRENIQSSLQDNVAYLLNKIYTLIAVHGFFAGLGKVDTNSQYEDLLISLENSIQKYDPGEVEIDVPVAIPIENETPIEPEVNQQQQDYVLSENGEKLPVARPINPGRNSIFNNREEKQTTEPKPINGPGMSNK